MPWTGFKHQLVREGIINDGSFEHQAEVWGVTYIPSISEYLSTYNSSWNFTGYQLIGLANSSGPPWAGHSNHWIQSGVAANATPRWVVSDDQAYPNEPGYQGRWSAKYEFDAVSESPWLIPFPAGSGGNPFSAPTQDEGWTDEEIETNIWTCAHDVGYTDATWPMGGFRPIGLNPAQVRTTFAIHAYSDGPCTLEVSRRDWSYDGPAPYFSRELSVQTQTFPVLANTWGEARFVSLIDPRIWPNYPDTIDGADNLVGTDSIFSTFKVRVTGGAPGQKVYVDNCWIWPDFTTTSAPLLTVGVAEWIRDDKGMYVGARLWFKQGTSGSAPAEAFPTEDQFFPAMVGGDLESATDPMMWADNITIYKTLFDVSGADAPLTQPFVQEHSVFFYAGLPGATPPVPNSWHISTVAPYDGTKHLRWVEGGTSATNISVTNSIDIVNGFQSLGGKIYTSRMNEGDSVTFSFRARVSAVTASPRNQSLIIVFYDESRSVLAGSTAARVTMALTASYQLFTFTAVAPAKTHSVLLRATAVHGSNAVGVTADYYMDAFDYLITPVA